MPRVVCSPLKAAHAEHGVGARRLRSERCAHLVHHRFRRAVDIREREAKNPQPGIDEEILPPVVLGEGCAMRSTVVLQHEALSRVVEISPPQKPPVFVVKRHLNFRPRQPAKDEQHPKPAFHRRLGGGLR